MEERVVHVAVVEKQNLPKENFSYIKTLKNFVKNRAIVGLSFVALSLTIFIMGASQLNTITYQLYFHFLFHIIAPNPIICRYGDRTNPYRKIREKSLRWLPILNRGDHFRRHGFSSDKKSFCLDRITDHREYNRMYRHCSGLGHGF